MDGDFGLGRARRRDGVQRPQLERIEVLRRELADVQSAFDAPFAKGPYFGPAA
jgi:hypothetical protein